MSPNSKSSGNGKDTTFKGGKEPPKEELSHIVNEFSKYFKSFPYYEKTAEKIEKKYNIERNNDGFWEDDDIKRVWGKTTRLNEKSSRRKTLCVVTMLEMLKKLFNCTTSEKTETKPDVNSNPRPQNQNSTYKKTDTTQSSSETCYIRIPLSVMDDNFDNSDDDHDPSDDEQPLETASQTEPAKNNLPYKLIYGVPSLTQIIRKTSYVLQYNNHTKNATWAFEILNNDTLEPNASRRNSKTDNSPIISYNLKLAGYNSGHLAAAGNHTWHQKAMNDTFSACNLVPQKKKLNGGIWKTLEEYCRECAKATDVRNVLVYTGPLYFSENNTKQNDKFKDKDKYKNKDKDKAVPTHLFKVIIMEYENKPKVEVECYRFPNKDVNGKHKDTKKQSEEQFSKDRRQFNLEDIKKKYGKQFSNYVAKLEEIEEQSGVLFSKKMPTIKLPDEEVTVWFKPPNEKVQNKEGQNKGQNQGQNKGIEIKLKVTPSKNDLFDSIG